MSILSAVAKFEQGIDDLEAAREDLGKGDALLLKYWCEHLREDLKTLLLMAMVEDEPTQPRV